MLSENIGHGIGARHRYLFPVEKEEMNKFSLNREFEFSFSPSDEHFPL